MTFDGKMSAMYHHLFLIVAQMAIMAKKWKKRSDSTTAEDPSAEVWLAVLLMVCDYNYSQTELCRIHPGKTEEETVHRGTA